MASQHKEILITGFLVASDHKGWFLSTQPNVKTCCLEAKQKSHEAIALLGSYPKHLSNQLLTIRGTLNITPNEKTQFSISSPQIIKRNTKSYKHLITLGLLGIALALFLTKRLQKEKDPYQIT